LLWIDNNIANTGTCADYPANVNSTFLVGALPNPFRPGDRLLLQSKDNQLLRVKVMDAAGRLLWYSSFNLTTGNNYITVPVNGWAGGIYFFEIKNERGERVTKRIVKTE
jgi:hypothetical protein